MQNNECVQLLLSLKQKKPAQRELSGGLVLRYLLMPIYFYLHQLHLNQYQEKLTLARKQGLILLRAAILQASLPNPFTSRYTVAKL